MPLNELKKVLELASIDTKKFGAHRTRSASTSAAKAMDISINTIMESAGWTQESTFVRFYNKPIISKDNFGNSLLQKMQRQLMFAFNMPCYVI